jgi:hypothetical protein
LRKVSDSQELISKLLMQMTHGGKGLELMPTEKLVDLMEGINISRIMFPIIILKGRAMEEVHHRERHTAGPLIDPIYLRFWMNKHNQNSKTKWRTVLHSMSGNITH